MTENPEGSADGASRSIPSIRSDRRISAGSSLDPGGLLVSRARLALLEVLLEVEPTARRGLIRIERRLRRSRQLAGWREIVLKDLAEWRKALHLTKDRVVGSEDWVERIVLDSLQRHMRELDHWRGAPRDGGKAPRRPRFRIAPTGLDSMPRLPQPPRYDPLAMTEQEADKEWAHYKCAARAHLVVLEATRSRRRACEDERWRRKIPKDTCYRLLVEHVVHEISYRGLAKRLEVEDGLVVTAQAVLDAVRDLALLVGISPEPSTPGEPAAAQVDGVAQVDARVVDGTRASRPATERARAGARAKLVVANR